METLAPSFSVKRNDAMREVYYTLSGLFSLQDIDALFSELLKASEPFIHDRKGFRVLGDLREFTVQTREVGEKMRLSQETSAKVGVDKMAIVYSSVLLKQQFRRVSEALECEFFESKADAIAWLRQ
ncbi:MAG: STAS/SEC14 domain-containing protein [Pseudomonadota bacterium]